VLSYYRMCSLTIECALLLSNVFSYYRMCSLTIECVLLHVTDSVVIREGARGQLDSTSAAERARALRLGDLAYQALFCSVSSFLHFGGIYLFMFYRSIHVFICPCSIVLYMSLSVHVLSFYTCLYLSMFYRSIHVCELTPMYARV